MRTISLLQEKLLCPPVSLFDPQLAECYQIIDGGLWKRFVKARQPEKRKKGIFKTIGRKQGKIQERRASRTSFSQPKDKEDDNLIY